MKTRKPAKKLMKKLTPEQRHILKDKGTEPPFTGKYCDNKKRGIYKCAQCGNVLFDSKTKYDSGTGWPSFFAPAKMESIATQADDTHLMKRTEVVCRKCGGHLGHMFDDGPEPTGLRFCINSAALDFREKSAGKTAAKKRRK